MSFTLQLDVDDPQVSREENDLLQYQHHNQPDSDSDSDSFWGSNSPISRVAAIASGLKTKCNSILTKVGLRKPRLIAGFNDEKCNNCNDMTVFISGFLDIEMTAQAGCPSCSILVRGIRKCIQNKRLLSSSKLSVMENWNSGCAGRQFIRTKHHSATTPGALGVILVLLGEMEIKNIFTDRKDVESKIVGELNFFGLEDDPASWDAIGVAYDISGATSSEAAFRWLQGRLDHCIRNHALCKTPDGSQLPPRVLDVGKHDGLAANRISDMDVRLCETNGACGRYICLSYCWGGVIDIQLTKGRYSSYLERIEWSKLPQGYRDAIHLTRKLGVRYIWIDSLCIIQDDAADWKTQASLMAPIFQGAHVTIAATKSSSPLDDYFSTSPAAYKSAKVEHRSDDGTLRHAYVRQTIPHFFSFDASHEPNYSLAQSPLLRRGWVFQERLLAPRILHLGEVEMAWECNEVAACECMGETKTYESEPRWAHTKGAHVRNLAAAADERDIQPDWRSTVEQYKKTNLTFEKDVFPAISGVVKNMQKYRSDRYLAGIWEGSLLDDLAWQSTNSRCSRPATWLAPTWSWASVTSRIAYTNYRTILAREYIEGPDERTERTALIEASVTPAGPDATAELLAAHLVLFGPMISARLEPADESENGYYWAMHEGWKLEFVPDYDISKPGPGCVAAGSTIYLLHLCREPELKRQSPREYQETNMYVLVLRRMDDGDGDGDGDGRLVGEEGDDAVPNPPGDGTYERIGIFIAVDGGGGDYVEKHGIECVVKLI